MHWMRLLPLFLEPLMTSRPPGVTYEPITQGQFLAVGLQNSQSHGHRDRWREQVRMSGIDFRETWINRRAGAMRPVRKAGLVWAAICSPAAKKNCADWVYVRRRGA
jgi:hypothetical protein